MSQRIVGKLLEENIQEISRRSGEPEWLRRFRLNAFKHDQTLRVGLGSISSWIITTFIGALLIPMGYAIYVAGRREIW